MISRHDARGRSSSGMFLARKVGLHRASLRSCKGACGRRDVDGASSSRVRRERKNAVRRRRRNRARSERASFSLLVMEAPPATAPRCVGHRPCVAAPRLTDPACARCLTRPSAARSIRYQRLGASVRGFYAAQLRRHAILMLESAEQAEGKPNTIKQRSEWHARGHEDTRVSAHAVRWRTRIAVNQPLAASPRCTAAIETSRQGLLDAPVLD